MNCVFPRRLAPRFSAKSWFPVGNIVIDRENLWLISAFGAQSQYMRNSARC